MIPHDTDTEWALIGTILWQPNKLALVIDRVDPALFYDPAAAATWATIEAMHLRGQHPETVTVIEETRRTGYEIQHQVIESSSGTVVDPAPLATILERLATARRIQAAGVEIARLGEAAAQDPAVMAAEAAAILAEVPVASGPDLSGLSTVSEFLATDIAQPPAWVVPGLLRRGWRCLVVAPEGVGKSVCIRQIAVCAAAAIHPFTHERVPTYVRTLIVDLENPDDAIAETCRPIDTSARATSTDYDEGRAWLWRRPGGIDLRGRKDQAALASVIEACDPDLVAIGPIYKAYRPGRDSDEVAAGQVMAVLDDLRTRHDFALLMEHHAPKASGLSARDLVPYGSSLWLRWPELGIKLIPCADDQGPPGSLMVGRFRMDRMGNGWPDRLDRGSRFPWVGYWRDGMDHWKAS